MYVHNLPSLTLRCDCKVLASHTPHAQCVSPAAAQLMMETPTAPNAPSVLTTILPALMALPTTHCTLYNILRSLLNLWYDDQCTKTDDDHSQYSHRGDCTRNVHRGPSTLTTILPALMALPTTHCTLYNILRSLLNLWYDDQCTKTDDDHSQYSHRGDCTRNVHRGPSTLTTILPALMALPTTHCTLYNILRSLLNLWYDDQCTKTDDDHSQYSHRGDCTRNVHRGPSTLTTILPALMALPTTHCTLYNILRSLLNLWYDDQCTKTDDDHSQYGHRGDCTRNVHRGPSTLTTILPALMALPPTHCTL